MLQNETYTGKTIYRKTKTRFAPNLAENKKKRQVVQVPASEWINVPDATPPLIFSGVYCRAQRILEDPHRRLRGQPRQIYRVRSHIRCPSYGTPVVGQALANGKYRYYRCRPSYSGAYEGKCDSRYIKVDLLERTVVEQVAILLSDPDRVLREILELNREAVGSARPNEIDRELGKIEERQRRVAHLYVMGSMPEPVLHTENK